MRHGALFTLVVHILAACAPLRSEPLPYVGPPEYGVVTSKRELDLRAGETRGERAAWASLSLDPIAIAAAVVAVEDDHGRSQINEYKITLTQGGNVTLSSRYVVEPGHCVMIRRAADTPYVIVVAQEETLCSAVR